MTNTREIFSTSYKVVLGEEDGRLYIPVLNGFYLHWRKTRSCTYWRKTSDNYVLDVARDFSLKPITKIDVRYETNLGYFL